MNFLHGSADYLVSGEWSKKAASFGKERDLKALLFSVIDSLVRSVRGDPPRPVKLARPLSHYRQTHV